MKESGVLEAEMPKTKKSSRVEEGPPPTGVRLPQELREHVDAICELEGIPLATFIRDAVQSQVQANPERQRRILLLSIAVTAVQFDGALKLGVLKGTEAEDQVEEIRRFFGQLVDVLKCKGEEHEKREEGQ